MPNFSAVSDSGLLRSGTVFRITIRNSFSAYSADNRKISTDVSKNTVKGKIAISVGNSLTCIKVRYVLEQASRTTNSSSDPRGKSPCMIGPVIWQANEPGHPTYPPLFKDYVEVIFTDLNSVMGRRPHHTGNTWSSSTTEEHVVCQEVRAGLTARRSDFPCRPNDWAESTVQ
ncbi:hypothetical protein TNCV_2624571 [Trichonephila clavipes]|nr:hypothetical protein TNCV_2624571 [Trichonephila clavipes]